MKKHMVAVGLWLAGAAFGCESLVLDLRAEGQNADNLIAAPDEDDQGEGGDAQSDDDSGPQALVWTGSDPQPPELPAIDPEARVLSVGNVPLSCGTALGSAFDGICASDGWQLILAVPPELDGPGVIDLADPRVVFYWAVHLASCGGGAGAGNGLWGTLELVPSGADELWVKIRGIEVVSGISFEGDYLATRCASP